MLWFRVALAAWGILAPLAMYGWLAVERADAVREQGKAVWAERTKTAAEMTTVCNGRVATIQSKIDADALEAARLSREAGEREAELKVQLAEAHGRNAELGGAAAATAADLAKVRAVVLELCRTRASCRDRAKLLVGS